MKNSKKNTQANATQNKKTGATQDAQGTTVEVLYQRMGEKWFAFSLIEDEVFVGSLTPEEIHGELDKQKVFKVSGNS